MTPSQLPQRAVVEALHAQADRVEAQGLQQRDPGSVEVGGIRLDAPGPLRIEAVADGFHDQVQALAQHCRRPAAEIDGPRARRRQLPGVPVDLAQERRGELVRAGRPVGEAQVRAVGAEAPAIGDVDIDSRLREPGRVEVLAAGEGQLRSLAGKRPLAQPQDRRRQRAEAVHQRQPIMLASARGLKFRSSRISSQAA